MVETGTCELDERFDLVLRKCMRATLVDNCNINECNVTAHVCTGEHMHCEDTIGTYACICDTGYRWNDDKEVGTVENPDGRTPTPEDNYWVYDVGSNSTDLSNHQGNGLYYESAGDSCVDYNECANDNPPCPLNSICQNIDIVAIGRTFECVCDTGYAPVYNTSTNGTDLNGAPYFSEITECKDIDECVEGRFTVFSNFVRNFEKK